MKLILLVASLLLVGCSAAPPGNQLHEPKVVIKDKHFKSDYIIYTGKRDITRIFVPFNQFNFDEAFNSIEATSSSSSSEEIEHPYTLFFIEGDSSDVDAQELYIFKDGKATKLLNDSTDITATKTNVIYIGGPDGIYKYDNVTNTATKQFAVSDGVKQLAYNNKTNTLYYLSVDKVYKLNEDVTASVVVPHLENVLEMVFGVEGNLYYADYSSDFYVVDVEAGGVPKKISGLPAESQKTLLVSPLYGMEEGAVLYVDGFVYILENDRAEKSPVKIEVPITAAAPQPTLIQYYAKDKKIYEFNVLYILINKVFEGLQEAVESYKNVLSSVKKASF